MAFIKKTFLLSICMGFVSLTYSSVEPDPEPQSNADAHIHYLNIVNDNSQRVILDEESHDPHCLDCHGQKLVTCFDNLSASERRETFKLLRTTQRKDYLGHLDLEGYKQFIDNYTQEQWDELNQILSDEEKASYPKTLQEQQEEIIKIIAEGDKASTVYHITTFILAASVPAILPAKIAFDVGVIAATGSHPVIEQAKKCHYEKHMKKSFDLTIHAHNSI